MTDEQVRGQHRGPDHNVWFTFQWKLCILSGWRINLWLNPQAESYTPNPSIHPPICFCIHLSIRPARSPAFTFISLLFSFSSLLSRDSAIGFGRGLVAGALQVCCFPTEDITCKWNATTTICTSFSGRRRRSRLSGKFIFLALWFWSDGRSFQSAALCQQSVNMNTAAAENRNLKWL